MPSKHRYLPITPRVPTELRDRTQRAVAEAGIDLNSLVTSLLRWYVGDINELPHRPITDKASERGHSMQPEIECKLCRVALQKYPNRPGYPITSPTHPLDQFPRAYGRNVDSGNDIRLDNCGLHGVNTGAKLAEHGLPWGWIDAETGARLCGNEESERHYSCARERFHEGTHQDAVSHAWPQRHHFLLTRLVPDGAAPRHLDLYETQARAETAAAHELGGKQLEWVAQEDQLGQYLGRLTDRAAYVISFIDVNNVQTWLDGVAAVFAPIARTS